MRNVSDCNYMGGGRMDGWREETHYSGFIVCWRDIFLHFLFFFYSFPFFQWRGTVLNGQEKGADWSRSNSREIVRKMDERWD